MVRRRKNTPMMTPLLTSKSYKTVHDQAWPFLLLCWLLVMAGAQADAVWPGQRGTAAGEAACEWTVPPCPGMDIREWHFEGRGGRKFARGIAVWASPALVLVDGTPMAFIGGCDQTLHALDLLKKEERWSKLTNGEIVDAPVVGVADGRQTVFWGSGDRFVYAHDAATGARLWTRELVPASPTLGEVRIPAPLLHGNTLYVACFVYDKAMSRNDQKGWLYALDAATGRERWRYEVSQGPVNAPIGAELDGRFTVFLAARRGRLLALDVTGPRPVGKWSIQMPHEVLGSPAVDAQSARPLVFLGSKFGDLLAFDARTGERVWKRMTGNWVDNSACVATLNGERAVFVGSHDYCLYALRASDGSEIWKRPLGGEVFSAPCLFPGPDGKPLVAAAALDNHLYVLDATSGRVETSYHTGNPLWDKVTKGEALWGSPAALVAGAQTALLFGSSSGTVFVLPLAGECQMRTKVQSPAILWKSLAVTLVIFLGVILPVVLLLPERKNRE